jgi:molybdopterin-guanine dinucleotide biosynthesis protein A
MRQHADAVAHAGTVAAVGYGRAVFDAIVLAGGRAERLDGADKPAIVIKGSTLLDRVIAAAHGATRVIAVGPERATASDVVWTREDPPGGGPVAAIAAGLELVEEAWCLVLAADLPEIAPAVPLLLTGAAQVDAAVLTCNERRNHLAAVWRVSALRGAIDRLETIENAAARTLYTGVDVVDVEDERGWGMDCDTWDDVRRADGEASS